MFLTSSYSTAADGSSHARELIEHWYDPSSDPLSLLATWYACQRLRRSCNQTRPSWWLPSSCQYMTQSSNWTVATSNKGVSFNWREIRSLSPFVWPTNASSRIFAWFVTQAPVTPQSPVVSQPLPAVFKGDYISASASGWQSPLGPRSRAGKEAPWFIRRRGRGRGGGSQGAGAGGRPGRGGRGGG